ncbi:MAG: hypothetical protein Kow0092_33880 [Deferrisomatales bacterium]
MEPTDVLAALSQAIQAEEEARAFYENASRSTDDPGGAEMFAELARFEAHHRDRLVALRDSLDAGGGWVAYDGRPLPQTPSAEASGRKAVGAHAGVLEALRVAVAAEERAEAQYRALAREAPDEKGRAMFEALAAEEAMHRKLLDDQYYALANRGVWLWGD